MSLLKKLTFYVFSCHIAWYYQLLLQQVTLINGTLIKLTFSAHNLSKNMSSHKAQGSVIEYL